MYHKPNDSLFKMYEGMRVVKIARRKILDEKNLEGGALMPMATPTIVYTSFCCITF